MVVSHRQVAAACPAPHTPSRSAWSLYAMLPLTPREWAESWEGAGQGEGSERRDWKGADDLPSLGLRMRWGRGSELRAGRPLGLCLPGPGLGAAVSSTWILAHPD